MAKYKNDDGPFIRKVLAVIRLCGMPEIPDGEFRAAVAVLLHYADTKTGLAYPSKRQVAEKSCTSKSTVNRMWKTLERLGFAVKTVASNGGRNKRNTYTVSPADHLGIKTVSPADTGGVTSGPLTVSPADTHESKLFNPSINPKGDSKMEKEKNGSGANLQSPSQDETQKGIQEGKAGRPIEATEAVTKYEALQAQLRKATAAMTGRRR